MPTTHYRRCLIATLLFIATIAAAAQSTPADLLARISAETDLTSIQRPWHLKLAITIFDANGKNPIEGSVEYWRDGKNSLRNTTLGDITYTVLEQDNKFFAQPVSSDTTDAAEDFIAIFLHPTPVAAESALANLSLVKQTLKKAPFDCLVLAPQHPDRQSRPFEPFTTYCLNPTSGNLNLAFTPGDGQFAIDRSGKFQDHIVPVDFSLGENGFLMAHGNVTEMSAFTPTPDFFALRPDLPLAQVRRTRISSGVSAGIKLAGDNPVYPREARASHIQGTVTLHALIGRDGRIRRLGVLSTPDISLSTAALDAVRTWRYKPYLLNGAPVVFDTTIVVNFYLN